jgi:UDP-GlcNAc:undecaprenyl-phosphate GlcNAc-1-phosphate transferase
LPLEARIVTGLAIALAVVYWATPLAIRVADRYQFYDKPAGYKGHSAPTPYLGGAALITGFVLALLVFPSNWDTTLPVLGGVLLLWVVGTVDDRRNVAWWLRVVIELGLATLLWSTDLGWDLGLGGALDLLLTMAWVVAVVNAFNLFDNMDGQASTMGLVTAIGLCAFGVATDHGWLAVAAAALSGACFGFLPHNLLTQPARIFLGDGGSMPLGYAVAALARIGTTHAADGWQALALGLLLVGIPALDTTLVIVSRRRRGISLLTGGQDHLTHRARRRLRTALAVALALGTAQIILSLLALAASRGSAVALGGVAVVYLLGLGVAVALIDNRIPAVPPDIPADESTPAPARRRSWRAIPWQAPFLGLFAIGVAVSPYFGGYYDGSVWGPMGLALLVILLAAGIARPPSPELPTWLMLGGMAGLGVWAIVSVIWADSIQQAVVFANRTFMLTAALGLLVVLIRDRRTAVWAFGAFVAAASVVTVVSVVHLLGGSAPTQFLGGRLNEPLEYIYAQASVSIMVMWPMLAIAGQRRSAMAAGAGMAGAVVCGGLVLLSQSRGAALAVIGSALIVLACCPGRLRRVVSLAVALGAILAVSSRLLDIYPTGGNDTAVVHDAMGQLILAAGVAGLVWAALAAFEQRLSAQQRLVARRTVAGLAVLAAVVVTGFAVAENGRIRDEVHRQYDAFVHLGVSQGGEQTASRLLSGAGNRYDYWRIAINTWRDNPFLGVGAGNYDEPYFLERTTAEDVRQPHSLLLQVLSELGLPGLALVLLFFAGVAAGVRRHYRPALESQTERVLVVGSLGAFSAWAVHTQVDWIHLLPGITGAALIGAAILVRPVPAREGARRPRMGAVGRGAIAALLAIPVGLAGVSLSRQVLAEHYRNEARSALVEGNATGALKDADRSLRLDGEDMQAHYVKAAAFARLGDEKSAQEALFEAVRREPGDFLTYALLGDLAVRRHEFGKAKYYYRTALARNPLEPSLQQLAKDPQSALD